MVETMAMRFGRLVLVIGVTSALLFPSCASTGDGVEKRYFKEDILERVNSLTRTTKIYKSLDTILIGDIFWHSGEFRTEMVENLRSTKRIDEADYSERMEQVKVEDATQVEFLASFYTSDKKWDDFNKSDSIWKIRIVDRNGNLRIPIEITRLKTKNIRDGQFFPFITAFRTIYRIRFLRDENIAGMEKYEIRIFSSLGSGEFAWETPESERNKAACTPDLEIVRDQVEQNNGVKNDRTPDVAGEHPKEQNGGLLGGKVIRKGIF